MTITPDQIQFYFPYKKDIYLGKDILFAWAYYSHYKIDLLSGEKINCDGFVELSERLNQNLNDLSSTLKILHLFYEYSSKKVTQDNSLLAIELEFQGIEKYKLKEKCKLKYSIKKLISFRKYKEQFSKGYDHLMRGDCYQYNLTLPFEIHLTEKINFEQIVSNVWSRPEDRGAYGHATFIPYLNKAFLSNSPECLYQIDQERSELKIETMPIKGTISLNSEEFDKKWEELQNCEKNESELFMITDLLRNDLAKLNPQSVKIVSLKSPLIVPGILHQFSKIKVNTNKNIKLVNLINAIFPGGSITGAPKKRVMEIIEMLEQRKRGLYCGSTLIRCRKLNAASINIRTAEVDLIQNKINYQAGGGVTLMSDVKEEWNEVLNKVDSFSRLI